MHIKKIKTSITESDGDIYFCVCVSAPVQYKALHVEGRK